MVLNKKKKNNLLLATAVFIISIATLAISYSKPVQAAFPGANGKITFYSDRMIGSEIWAMNADGSSQTSLTNRPLDADYKPFYSPDGTKIAFMSAPGGSNFDVVVMDADGSGLIKITDAVGDQYYPTFSPDGTSIVFASNRDGNFEIYVMDSDGNGQTRLTNNAAIDTEPVFSPDGTKIAFQSTRDGNAEIYVMNADGTSQTRLTNNAASETLPDWSPDGSKITFTSTRDGNNEIYVMNADGTDQVRLTNNGTSDIGSVFSPDGAKLAFASNRDGNFEIYVMDSDGNGQTRLTTNAATDEAPDWQPLITPTVTNDSSVTTTAGKPVTINVLSNDTDPYDSLDPSSITITSAPLNGSTSVNTTTGEITYTPNASFLGNDTFTYQVCSSYSELCDTATVNITVTPGLPKTGDGSGSDNLLWMLVALGVVSVFTVVGTKFKQQREHIKK